MAISRHDATSALDTNRGLGARVLRARVPLVGFAAALGLIAISAPAAIAIPHVNKLPGNDMPFGRVGPATRPLGSKPGGVKSYSAPAGAYLQYNGGRVISNVKVVQVIWGPGTYIPETTSSGSPSVGSYFAGVLNSPYIDWLSEYNTTGVSFRGTTTNQTIGRGVFAGQYTIAPSAANNGSTVDDVANIQPELGQQIDAGNLPAPEHRCPGQLSHAVRPVLSSRPDDHPGRESVAGSRRVLRLPRYDGAQRAGDLLLGDA